MELRKIEGKKVCCKGSLYSVALLGLVFWISPALAVNYQVSGSGTDADGIYMESGSSDGVPQYVKGNWRMYRMSSNGMGMPTNQWVIEDQDTPPLETRQFINPDGLSNTPPNDGGWWYLRTPDKGDEEFYPVPDLTVTLAGDIPTVNAWGIAVLAVLASASAVYGLRRRRRTA